MKYCRPLFCCGNNVNEKESKGVIQEYLSIKLWFMSGEIKFKAWSQRNSHCSHHIQISGLTLSPSVHRRKLKQKRNGETISDGSSSMEQINYSKLVNFLACLSSSCQSEIQTLSHFWITLSLKTMEGRNSEEVHCGIYCYTASLRASTTFLFCFLSGNPV